MLLKPSTLQTRKGANDDSCARTDYRSHCRHFVKPDIPIVLQPYLPIMVVAALDALLGAARAYFERSFSDKVFVISFISNVLTSALLVLLGNQLGVGSQLQTAVIVVLGIRIFSNVSAIRRFIFKG